MRPGFRQRVLVLIICVFAVTFIPSVQAQTTAPASVIAFAGTDASGSVDIYLLDVASGSIGQLDAPVTPETDLAWQPGGAILAFVTDDGGYGLLRSLHGCFGTEGVCLDIIYVIPPFMVSGLEWMPDGESLVLVTDDGLKLAPPRAARRADFTALTPDCPRGIAIASQQPFLLCAAEDAENVQVSVYSYDNSDGDFVHQYDIGTYPDITALAAAPDGSALVGTLETGGDSAFFADSDGETARISDYQIHLYAAQFAPDGSQIVLAGAIADSTGDSSLRDGDTAELFLYSPDSGALEQIAGFTGVTALTWAPDGSALLSILDQEEFVQVDPTLEASTPLGSPLPGGQASAPAWNLAGNGATVGLPDAPTATPPQITIATPAITVATPIQITVATPAIVVATPVPTLTPYKSPTPLPTLTPFATFTPPPTWTPIPSATPGSPLGAGCQYARNPQQVYVGDAAVVTPQGTAIRFRSAASLTGPMIAELPSGTRMSILAGPFCADGYRWWQVRLEDGRLGFLADSEPTAYWIEKAAAFPTATVTPVESISFVADRYTITQGQCVTIRWDVEGIKEVYYRGVGVTGHDSRQECPTATTTYTLRVIRRDNSEIQQTITILVTAP